MLSKLLNDNNLLVRIAVGSVVVFYPLYVLQSMGYKWPYFVAMLVLLGMALRWIGTDFLNANGPFRKV